MILLWEKKKVCSFHTYHEIVIIHLASAVVSYWPSEVTYHFLFVVMQIGDRFIGRRLVQKFYDKALTTGLQGYAQLYVFASLLIGQ